MWGWKSLYLSRVIRVGSEAGHRNEQSRDSREVELLAVFLKATRSPLWVGYEVGCIFYLALQLAGPQDLCPGHYNCCILSLSLLDPEWSTHDIFPCFSCEVRPEWASWEVSQNAKKAG